MPHCNISSIRFIYILNFCEISLRVEEGRGEERRGWGGGGLGMIHDAALVLLGRKEKHLSPEFADPFQMEAGRLLEATG